MEKPQFGLKAEYRLYTCANCGRDQLIQTNHTDTCIDYCGRGDTTQNAGCSWKPSFGGKGNAYPMNGRTYRRFIYVDPTEWRPEMAAEFKSVDTIIDEVIATWCANRYLEQERTAYEDISATRKRGEQVTAAQVKGWFNRLRLKCDSWTKGAVNWQEIADNYNDQEY